ncbi:toprim domain-containing protein, partial [bacterium]|nr:toprim domain-containing protein [bacterium]
MIDHQYLRDKGIKDHGTRLDDQRRLVIPARNIYGEITTVQTITAKGEKRFLSGGAKRGSFYILDDQPIDPDGIVYICEGFATAASVQEATIKPTICAFDSSNLLPVAKAIRERYPNISIVICGDDDRFHKDGTLKTPDEQNKGFESATAAAIAVGGKVCFPLFKSDDGKPTDFNDLYQREGLEVARAQIESAAVPEASTSSTYHLPPVPIEVFPVEIQGMVA